MSITFGPGIKLGSGLNIEANIDLSIITDGLILYLDAGNLASYPGTGNTWYDLSGIGNHFTLDSSGLNYNSNGYFVLTDAWGGGKSGITGLTSTCTVVFWIKTTDEQSLFLNNTNGSGGPYLGAYRVGYKQYYSGCGSPVFYMDTVQKNNIYDYIRDNTWHMLEFKNVNWSWAAIYFNKYTSYTFGNGAVAIIAIYNRNITQVESLQNYNATKNRYT